MNRNLLALILIIIAAVLSGTFTWDRYAGIKEARSKNLEYENAIDDFDKLIAKRDEIQKSYNKIPAIDIDDRLDKLIPDSIDNVRLIIDVGHIISRHGVYPKSITATSPDIAGPQTNTQNTSPNTPVNPVLAKMAPAAAKLNNVTLAFSISTTYENMVDIMKDIESSLRILDITDITFSSNDTKDGIYDFSFTLVTYWLK